MGTGTGTGTVEETGKFIYGGNNTHIYLQRPGYIMSRQSV